MNVDYRQSFDDAYKKNTEKFKLAIAAFRSLQDPPKELQEFQKKLKSKDKSLFKNGKFQEQDAKVVIEELRYKYIDFIAEKIFSSNQNEYGVVQAFLWLKLKENRDLTGDPKKWTIETTAWKKLFDKIEAGIPMKIPYAKQQSKIAKQEKARKEQQELLARKADISFEWKRLDRAIADALDAQIVHVNFQDLSKEIGTSSHLYWWFLGEFQKWLSRSPQKFQALFSIENFGRQFKGWQDELVKDLKTHKPAVKRQLIVFNKQIVSLCEAVGKLRRDQKKQEDDLADLNAADGFKEDLPAAAVNKDLLDMLMSPEFQKDARRYEAAVAALPPESAPQQNLLPEAAQQPGAVVNPAPAAIRQQNLVQQQGAIGVPAPAPIQQQVAVVNPVPAVQQQGAIDVPAPAAQQQVAVMNPVPVVQQQGAMDVPAPAHQQGAVVNPVPAIQQQEAAVVPNPAPLQKLAPEVQKAADPHAVPAASAKKPEANGFIVLLKRCGALLYKIVTLPIWLFKWLFDKK